LGFDVTLDLAASSHLKPEAQYACERFDTYESLQTLLKKQLSENSYDWMFHLAAVSDFSFEKVEGKISSDADMTLKLKKNPKIIDHIKGWSKNKDIHLVGFKLTSGLSLQEAQTKVDKLMAHAHTDYVVQNDVTTLQNRSQHQFNIYHSGQVQTAHGVPEMVSYFTEQIGATL
jgi:phosphopantothenoylcysteine decarboxylase/phosphopantothenate--cysteine ligase